MSCSANIAVLLDIPFDHDHCINIIKNDKIVHYMSQFVKKSQANADVISLLFVSHLVSCVNSMVRFSVSIIILYGCDFILTLFTLPLRHP